jgi:hypothetical protein
MLNLENKFTFLETQKKHSRKIKSLLRASTQSHKLVACGCSAKYFQKEVPSSAAGWRG